MNRNALLFLGVLMALFESCSIKKCDRNSFVGSFVVHEIVLNSDLSFAHSDSDSIHFENEQNVNSDQFAPLKDVRLELIEDGGFVMFLGAKFLCSGEWSSDIFEYRCYSDLFPSDKSVKVSLWQEDKTFYLLVFPKSFLGMKIDGCQLIMKRK